MGSELTKFVKAPPVIPKALRSEKEGLSFRDKAWVYNDVIAILAGAPFLVMGITWVNMFTMPAIGIILIILSGLVVLFGVCAWMNRVLDGVDHPFGHTCLSHKGRALLCLYDRNRRVAPHREVSSKWTLPNQYSIWPERSVRGSIEGQHGARPEVRLLLLEHSYPGYFGRLLWGRRWKVSLAVHNGREGIKWVGLDPSLDELIDAQAEFEKKAGALENAAYGDAVKDLEVERNILSIRRS